MIIKDRIDDMQKSVTCLASQLPEKVYDHVEHIWILLKATLTDLILEVAEKGSPESACPCYRLGAPCAWFPRDIRCGESSCISSRIPDSNKI